eukprot:TRINITY_DN12619_c0_g1_i8.p1 TRINITY_DN12619_c0_g1~~TRINITY_DN12619_c0_g1_i8.p1  ORF type:complete len:2027 (+),score=485.44 TRINITY_DN12619_c0_g1_i8:425-6505(+)
MVSEEVSKALLATTMGQLSFTTPQSYRSVHAVMKRLRLISPDQDGTDKCITDFQPRSGLLCPAGHIPKTADEMAGSCRAQGFTCPLGSTCFCHPCKQAAEIEISAQVSSSNTSQVCTRMQQCTTSQQLAPITFTVQDRLHAERVADLAITFTVFHSSADGTRPTFSEQQGHGQHLSDGVYQFEIVSSLIGTHFVEVRSDGDLIELSPFLIDITARDCPNAREVATLTGECVCDQVSHRINGTCVIDSQYITDKTHYIIGGIAVQGRTLFEAQYEATSQYLTQRVGSLFDPPITFSIRGFDANEAKEAIAAQEINFFFGDPSFFVCSEVEYNLIPMLTVERQASGMNLHKFGGSIVVRAGSSLQTLGDLRNTNVALTSLLALGGGQSQWLRLQNEGIGLFSDIAQVTITSADVSSMEELAEGRVDAAFVKDDILEILAEIDDTFDPSNFRILAPLNLEAVSGQNYPRLTSTVLYPEWPLAALTNTDFVVTKAVTQALLAMSYDEQAAVIGRYHSWQPALSYSTVRGLNSDLGYITQDASGQSRCPQTTDAYDNIRCAEGHYLRPRSEARRSCNFCPGDMECFCRPCYRAMPQVITPVALYDEYMEPLDEADLPDVNLESTCEQMSHCVVVKQRQTVTFQVADNAFPVRGEVAMSFTLHDSDVTGSSAKASQGVASHLGNGIYTLNTTVYHVGAHVFEIIVKDYPIYNTPFIVAVIPRDCHEDLTEPNAIGECVCMANAYNNNGTCELIRQYSARKTSYTIGALTAVGKDAFMALYSSTFESYLSDVVGQKFDPPITFNLRPLTSLEIFPAMKHSEIDFLFTDPSQFQCFSIQYGLRPLVTIERLQGGVPTGSFGGTIVARVNDTRINNLDDLKHMIVGANSLFSLGGGQSQWLSLMENGVQIFVHPKQITFTFNEQQAIEYLQDGFVDVAFVQSHVLGELEALGAVSTNEFKIIGQQHHIVNGAPFPARVSTDIYPEWPFSAATGTDFNVMEEVAIALMALDASSPQAQQGLYNGWRIAQSYDTVRSLMENIGYITKDEEDNFQCFDDYDIFEAIRCPEGFYKREKNVVLTGCTNAGLPCPPGKECICRPCRAADPVEVVPTRAETLVTAALDRAYNVSDVLNCQRMKYCTLIEQGEEVVFDIYDNLYPVRGQVDVTWNLHDAGSALNAEYQTGRASIMTPGHYQFTISTTLRGSHVMEIFTDGRDTYNSPFILAVKDKTCPNNLEVADASGACVCDEGASSFMGDCVETSALIVGIAIPVVLILLAAILIYARIQQKKADALWTIERKEIFFDDPPENLGRGAFGMVLKGQYRGTTVAVKRVMPSRFFAASSDAMFAETGSSSKLGSGSTRFASKSSGLASGRFNVGIATSRFLTAALSDTEEKKKADKGKPKRGSKSRHKSVTETELEANTKANAGTQSLSRRFRSLNQLSATLGDGGRLTRIARAIFGKSFGIRRRMAAMRDDFMTEMRLLSKLRHPNIVTVMGAVIDRKKEPLLILEFMEHGSLYDLMRNPNVEVDTDLVMPIIKDIVSGMLFLHTSKEPIVHSDIKSLNILCDSNFRAKVCDFGLSMKAKCGAVGTPFWMAPEVINGGECTVQSDVYAFGITLWECMTQQDPYQGENVVEVLRAVANVRSKKPKRPVIPKSCPVEIQELMQACWKTDAEQRPSFVDIDNQMRTLQVRNVGESILKSKQEKKQQGSVLQDVFPPHIAKALAEGRRVEPEHKDCVSVFFSDIVGFTNISSELDPIKVSDMLDRLYTQFDTLCQLHDIFKVETIGDAFMCASNLIKDQDDHTARLANFALDAIDAAAATMIDEEDPERGTINIRVGIHAGPVVGNVVGSRNPRYCLFGDTINTASRMESSSEKGRVHLSKTAADLLREQDPSMLLESRGRREIKGKGKMHTYWLLSNGGGSGDPIVEPRHSIVSVQHLSARPSGDRSVNFESPAATPKMMRGSIVEEPGNSAIVVIDSDAVPADDTVQEPPSMVNETIKLVDGAAPAGDNDHNGQEYYGEDPYIQSDTSAGESRV